MECPKYIEYDGLRFCRDEKTGYYLNSTIRKRLHRYVWEKEVGTIPKGCQIHHINGNKADNRIDNLSIMTASGHQRLHGQGEKRKDASRANIEKARPAAIAWHKSEDGRKWHSESHKGKPVAKHERICEVCGKKYQGTKSGRFCSNACKSKYRRMIGADNIEKVCEMCGNVYVSTRFGKQKYCSSECASKAHYGWYERWKEQQAK